MADPYRPTYYEQDTTYRHNSYKPGDYTPQSALQLSQSRPQGPSSPGVYAPVGPYLGATQPDLSADDDRRSGHSRRHRRHSHSGRSRSRRRGRHSDDSSDDDRERDRSRSKSRVKEVGATLAGAAIAGLAGRKLGKENKLITVGAALAGGYAAHELEKRREDRNHSRHGSGPLSPRENHSSIGSVVAGAQHRVENLLSPKDAHHRRDRDRDSEYEYRSKSKDDRHGRRKESYDYEYERRSRSQGGYADGGRRGRYYDDSD